MKLSLKSAAVLAVPATTIAALPAASAATPATAVTLLLPFNGASSQYLGSVITVAPSYTAYAVNCPSAAASATDVGDFCGQEFTITQGPSVWELQYTVSGVESLSAHCEGNIASLGPLTCTESEGGYAYATGTGSAAYQSSVDTTVLSASDLSSVFGVVSITAGAEKLGAATASASAETASATGSSAAASSAASAKSAAKSTDSASMTKTASTASTGSATATGSAAKATGTGAAGANMVQKGAMIGAAGVALVALAL